MTAGGTEPAMGALVGGAQAPKPLTLRYPAFNARLRNIASFGACAPPATAQSDSAPPLAVGFFFLRPRSTDLRRSR
jgi:hypothetical protein